MRNVLWGVVLISIGIILGLNALDITSINIFFNGWWTLFIIVPCFIDLFKDEDKTGNIIGIIIGCFLLLACQGIVDFSSLWKLLMPVILIIIGLSCIFKNMISSSYTKKIKKINSKNCKNNKELLAVFSSQKVNIGNEEFTGSEISAVFGGANIDLSEAKIKDDIVITTSAIFGGIDIYVPKDVNVKVSSTSIFGGVENKIKNNSDNKKTIYINATCLFGGVGIK